MIPCWKLFVRKSRFTILVRFCTSHDVDPSEIGLLCEELVSDHDEEIVKILQRFVEGGSKNVEETLCVQMAHVCSQEEYDRVWMGVKSDG